MARRWAHPVRAHGTVGASLKGSLAWHYLKRQKRFLLLLLVVLPVGGIAYIPVIGLTRAMVDQGIVDQTVPLSYYLWRIIGLAVLAGFFVFALSQTLARVAYQLEYDLRTDLYHSIQTAEVRDLDTIAGGQLITRSLSDLQIVQSIMNLLPIALALGPAMLRHRRVPLHPEPAARDRHAAPGADHDHGCCAGSARGSPRSRGPSSTSAPR